MYKAKVESEEMPKPEIKENPPLGPDQVQNDSNETVAREEVQPEAETLEIRVSNGTGQCNFSGQRDNGTSSKSCHGTGPDGILTFCHGMGREGMGWDFDILTF